MACKRFVGSIPIASTTKVQVSGGKRPGTLLPVSSGGAMRWSEEASWPYHGRPEVDGMARKVAQRTAKTARRGYGEGSLYQETVRAPDGSVTYRWVAAFERGRDPATGKHLPPKRCRAATLSVSMA